MKCLRLALLMIFLICDLPSQSNASFLGIVRKFAQDYQNSNHSNQMAPAPSPVPVTKINSGNTEAPVKSPNTETCDAVPNKCDIMEYHFTACIPLVGNGPDMHVIILNDYKSSLKVNITVLPANNTWNDIVIPEHQMKKVNLSSNIDGNTSFLLNIENGNCTIHLGASVALEGFYTNYLTPINGGYLLFVTALFIGGTCICFKLRKRGRHLDGFKYQELEMEKQESTPPFKIQMPGDWDRDWDGEWDDEKE